MFIVHKSVTSWRIFISDAELGTFTIEQECCLGLIKFWPNTLYRFFRFWIGVIYTNFLGQKTQPWRGTCLIASRPWWRGKLMNYCNIASFCPQNDAILWRGLNQQWYVYIVGSRGGDAPIIESKWNMISCNWGNPQSPIVVLLGSSMCKCPMSPLASVGISDKIKLTSLAHIF